MESVTFSVAKVAVTISLCKKGLNSSQAKMKQMEVWRNNEMMKWPPVVRERRWSIASKYWRMKERWYDEMIPRCERTKRLQRLQSMKRWGESHLWKSEETPIYTRMKRLQIMKWWSDSQLWKNGVLTPKWWKEGVTPSYERMEFLPVMKDWSDSWRLQDGFIPNDGGREAVRWGEPLWNWQNFWMRPTMG